MTAKEQQHDLDDEDTLVAYIGNIERTHGNLSYSVPNSIIRIVESYLQAADAVVIDMGSRLIKAGYPGKDAPKFVFPTVINGKNKNCYIGDKAMEESNLKNSFLKYPIEHSIITNWDDFQKLFEYTFNSALNRSPINYKVLMTEPPCNPKANREKMTQVMFETYNVPAFYLATDAVLALYAIGRTTGLVIKSGASVTHIVPVQNGYAYNYASRKLEIGGTDVTGHLCKIMAEKGYYAKTMQEKEWLNEIKERICYVARDYKAEFDRVVDLDEFEMECELPDGRVIEVGDERFRATEIMFQPEFVGIESDGISGLALESIWKLGVDIRRDMYNNILLCGGNTMFDGFGERLKKEIQPRAGIYNDVKIIAMDDREYGEWIGGSILASLSTFEEMWITKQEYDEYGPCIVHRKCTL